MDIWWLPNPTMSALIFVGMLGVLTIPRFRDSKYRAVIMFGVAAGIGALMEFTTAALKPGMPTYDRYAHVIAGMSAIAAAAIFLFVRRRFGAQ